MSIIAFVLVWGILHATPCAAASANQAQPPNFVFVLGEGQGWTSTSVQMDKRVSNSKSDFFQTPNLERLAEEGMRFADFYAPSPRCTPSRATFFTGKSPAQLGMTFVSQERGANRKVIPPNSLLELPLEETTIAELLKDLGYATAHFGKWHVGRVHPSRHGFDESDGATSNGGPENVPNPNPKEAYGIIERGIAFIAKQVKAGKPFYLQVSHYGGRSAEDARKDTYKTVLRWVGGREDNRTGAAAVNLDMDITIGMVLKKIDELGISGNTYVIYTADHGTPGRWNGPLANGKGTVWEGGIRVPLFIRGPGIRPGTFSSVRASGADLFVTIAELARVEEPFSEGVEGGSLVPVLMNSGDGIVKRAREEFVIHFPHYDKDPIGPASAILLGDYKLIRAHEDGKRHLFDLSKDLGERHSLASEMPEKVAELDDRLSEYLKTMNAQMPTLNPNFDPTKQAPEAREGGNRRGRDRRGRNRVSLPSPEP